MTLEEIDRQLNELTKEDKNKTNRIYKLRKLRMQLINENCKKDIGRCFKIVSRRNITSYVKVIDAPEVENEYQYPALWIYPNIKLEPFRNDIVFSGVWGKGSSYDDDDCKEITKEEFNTVFRQACEDWKETIVNI